MNGLEERLTDALRTAGETVRPEDVPAPRFAERGAGPRRRPPAVALATVAVTAAGVSAGLLTMGDDGSPQPVSPPSAPASPSGRATPSPAAPSGQVDPSAPAVPFVPAAPSAPGWPSLWAGSGVDVSVFLCSKTSSNPSCGGRDATKAQREALIARLEKLPAVDRVEYESKQEVHERVKKRFPEASTDIAVGDIPDSLLIWLADGAKAEDVQSAVLGEGGVDTVVIE